MLTKIMKWASVAALLLAILWHSSQGLALIVQFVVCAAAVMAVVQGFQMGKAGAIVVFIAIAALFNPIVPVGLSPAILRGTETVCLGLFLLSVLTFRQQPRFSLASITDRTPGSESL